MNSAKSELVVQYSRFDLIHWRAMENDFQVYLFDNNNSSSIHALIISLPGQLNHDE